MLCALDNIESISPCTARRGLEERLKAGEHVLCAEGYLLALCRMGYVATGVWVPEFLIDHPEVLRRLHYDFVHAGSDVTEAYQVILIVCHKSYDKFLKGRFKRYGTVIMCCM